MKIQKVLHSCDNNPLYLDFWPVVSKIWKQYFHIEPILLYMGNENIDIDDSNGTVIRFSPILNIPISLQTLWIRYWYPINEPNTTFMISDIDMLPLSKYYFIDSINKISDNNYIHINPCIETYGLIPSCYHIAKGNMFQKVLDLDIDFTTDITKVYLFDNTHNNGWFNDEKYATQKILEYQKKHNDLQLIPRIGGQNGRRIDRSFWQYDPTLVSQEFYFDAHCIRPYSQYKIYINYLVSLLLGNA